VKVMGFAPDGAADAGTVTKTRKVPTASGAGVDAQAAADAFELLAVADVDAHRADVYAGHAVDAVAAAVPSGRRPCALPRGSPRQSR
jgi:hypothetical protein